MNNAGILRDRMLVNMTEDDWDAVITCPPQGHVRAHPPRGRATGGSGPRRASESTARVINTTSASGLYGNVGQVNYGAAKAGIAAFALLTRTAEAQHRATLAGHLRL